MKKNSSVSFPLLLIVFFLTVFSPAKAEALSFNDPANAEALAASIVNAMSDEQALAQTFMLGWVGEEPSPLIMEWIRGRNIGGVKIFGWNTANTIRLAETVGLLQQNALANGFGIPLFVATDQEGGMVRHIKGATRETPGNMAIGATGRPADAYWAGYYIGKELSLLGVNMNFAPDVDLYTNSASVLIGPRSFGTDPVQAGILGAAFAKGQEAAGVIATAKHYPGHGDTPYDSHGILPRIDVSFNTLWERELVPYRMMTREGLSAIMTGHLAFPQTPSGEAPASLSPWFLQDVLQGMIGFKGLVITDDLMMGGALNYTRSLSQAAKQAISAGNDIIMLSETPTLYSSIWTFLAGEMENDPLFNIRVREAARKILLTKLNFFKRENSVPFVPDLSKIEKGLEDEEANAFFLSLAARSVTVVKDYFPLKAEEAGRILLAGQYQDFFDAGRRAFPQAQTYRYTSSAEELTARALYADTVIFCMSDESDLRLLRNLRGLNRKIIVFSILSPVYLSGLDWVDGALAVYSYAPVSFNAGFSAILGRIPGEGAIPFPLEQR